MGRSCRRRSCVQMKYRQWSGHQVYRYVAIVVRRSWWFFIWSVIYFPSFWLGGGGGGTKTHDATFCSGPRIITCLGCTPELHFNIPVRIILYAINDYPFGRYIYIVGRASRSCWRNEETERKRGIIGVISYMGVWYNGVVGRLCNCIVFCSIISRSRQTCRIF